MEFQEVRYTLIDGKKRPDWKAAEREIDDRPIDVEKVEDPDYEIDYLQREYLGLFDDKALMATQKTDMKAIEAAKAAGDWNSPAFDQLDEDSIAYDNEMLRQMREILRDDLRVIRELCENPKSTDVIIDKRPRNISRGLGFEARGKNGFIARGLFNPDTSIESHWTTPYMRCERLAHAGVLDAAGFDYVPRIPED